MMARQSDVLGAALATAVAEDRVVDALRLALAWWRHVRHPVLADLVERLAEEHAKRVPPRPPRGQSSDEFHAAWLAAARKADEASLGALLPSLARKLPSANDAAAASFVERLDALSGLPPDPRVATALVDILARAKSASFGANVATALEEACALLAAIADERTVPALEALLAKPRSSRLDIRTLFETMLPELIAKIEHAGPSRLALEDIDYERATGALLRLDPLAEPRPRSRPAREGNVPAPSAPASDRERELALLELVAANLEDDGPREVLADFWLDRSDPRGEHVRLAMKVARRRASAEEKKRIQRLLSGSAEAILGDLTLVLGTKVYDRGLLDEVSLVQNAGAAPVVWEAAARDPRLLTIRQLHKGKANESHYRRFVFSPFAKNVRAIEICSRSMLDEAFALGRPFVAEALRFRAMPGTKSFDRLATTQAFPRLSTMTVGVRAVDVQAIPRVGALVDHFGLRSLTLDLLDFFGNAPRDATRAWPRALHGPLRALDELSILAPFGGEDQRLVFTRAGNDGLAVRALCGWLKSFESLFACFYDAASLVLEPPKGGVSFVDGAEAIAEARALFRRFAPGTVTGIGAWARILARVGIDAAPDVDAAFPPEVRIVSPQRHRDA